MVDSVFTLELLALTKFAIQIHSDPDIKAFQSKKQYFFRYMSAKEWEPVMEKKISSLNLPMILKKKVIALMQPISVQIDQWALDHFSISKCIFEHLTEYVWKDNGTIDRLKTANNYIQCENNNLVLRFLMACVYWLEEEAKQLWGKMPETSRRRLDGTYICPLSSRWQHAVKDWITFLKSGAVDWRKHSFSHPLSWYCQDTIIIQGNLLQQLSPQDRLNVFKIMMKKNIPMQTKIFCLLKMSAEHFEEVIEKDPLHVFTGLCNWPLHRQFQEMADRIFSLLNEQEFLEFLLEVICFKMYFAWMDCNYVELLNELWNRSPDYFKQYIATSEFFDILKMALNHDYKKPFQDRCPLVEIVGFRAKKVLYMAVPNRYCVVCSKATVNKLPGKHCCIKNWYGGKHHSRGIPKQCGNVWCEKCKSY
ncbi:uncharacterized protein NPIL_588651 [Nephila pilipes]|uniref:Uncharacterized protein n=1 Tax=Nephila pilipes TaxID=299642 RepID=A0A8X6UXV4_NEPPI|nr:uncharacterized protein NPIL_588651 [Nephila pilipes]